MVRKFDKDMVWALVVSLALVSALCFYFEPKWDTNDDVAYSMIAHGYGAAAISLPTLVFSNVIWGYFVQSIPQINGVLGYSIATLGVLVLSGVVVLFALRKVGLSWIVSCAVAIFLLVRPVLFPQFTINAGLMSVGAFACWYLYGTSNGGKPTLIVGCVLAFLGYLIRDQEFALVLAIATPLLPWGKLVKDGFAVVAALVLAAAIGGAMYMDRQAYQGED
ncbi:MAG: hypothetical protein LBI31_02225, partial [Zoogloeaceae bacterium]|nr:hypothetical protein [Zoogloeaceae bacterium]